VTTVQQRVDLRSQLCPVRDQGVRPTCSAIAVSTAHAHTRQSPVPLSSEYLHWHATSGQANGPASLTAIADALRQEGQPLEGACPYVYGIRASNWSPPVGVEVFRRASALRPKVDLQIIADSLNQGNCPILGISVPQPFYLPKEPWVIAAEGPIRCFHAVLGVGLGEYRGKPTVLIRNSWGEEWGEDGHAWLDEDFLKLHLQLVLLIGKEAM